MANRLPDNDRAFSIPCLFTISKQLFNYRLAGSICWLLLFLLPSQSCLAKEKLDLQADSLQELLAPFTRIRHIKLAYHEQRSSMFLKRPRQFHGYIEYIAPNRFIKQIAAPVSRQYVINSDKLTIHTEASAEQPASTRVVSLDDYPQFRQFKALFTGLLTGNAEQLKQFYRYQITPLSDDRTLLMLKSRVSDVFIESQQNISQNIEILFRHQQITTITMFGFAGEQSVLHIDSILNKDVFD